MFRFCILLFLLASQRRCDAGENRGAYNGDIGRPNESNSRSIQYLRHDVILICKTDSVTSAPGAPSPADIVAAVCAYQQGKSALGHPGIDASWPNVFHPEGIVALLDSSARWQHGETRGCLQKGVSWYSWVPRAMQTSVRGCLVLLSKDRSDTLRWPREQRCQIPRPLLTTTACAGMRRAVRRDSDLL